MRCELLCNFVSPYHKLYGARTSVSMISSGTGNWASYSCLLSSIKEYYKISSQLSVSRLISAATH